MKINVGTIRRALNLAQRAYSEYQKFQSKKGGSPRRTDGVRRRPEAGRRHEPTRSAAGYPGDFSGNVDFAYSPNSNNQADPGEVVWTWVPFEEDYSQGKDRPVLIVGQDGPYLLGLMLTSKDRNNRFERDADYLDIGSGAWDRQGRPSEVKLDRVLRVDPNRMRREGATLDRSTFEAVRDAFTRRRRSM